MTDPTPGQLAEYDQRWALVNSRLDDLIGSHRRRLREGGSREAEVVRLAGWLRRSVELQTVAEILTAAVDRLAGSEASASEEPTAG